MITGSFKYKKGKGEKEGGFSQPSLQVSCLSLYYVFIMYFIDLLFPILLPGRHFRPDPEQMDCLH